VVDERYDKREASAPRQDAAPSGEPTFCPIMTPL